MSCVRRAGQDRCCAGHTPRMSKRSPPRCKRGFARTDLGSVLVPTKAPEELLADAGDVLPEMVEVRRRIHRVPELGLELPRTQQVVLDELADLGVDIRTGDAVSSVVADLRGGGDSGRVILLRADMDALPMPE